jgi:hypothetical protein
MNHDSDNMLGCDWNVITLECFICHRGLFLTLERYLDRHSYNFYFDFWTGKEYCPDHKPLVPPKQFIVGA